MAAPTRGGCRAAARSILGVARLLWIAGLPRPMRAIVVAGLRQAGQNVDGQDRRITPGRARPMAIGNSWSGKTNLQLESLCTCGTQGIGAILCPPHALPATPHVKAFDLLGGGELLDADQPARVAVGNRFDDSRGGGRG